MRKVTWTALWPQVAQYRDSFISLFENSVLHGCRECLLAIEYTSDTCEL